MILSSSYDDGFRVDRMANAHSENYHELHSPVRKLFKITYVYLYYIYYAHNLHRYLVLAFTKLTATQRFIISGSALSIDFSRFFDG